MSDRLTSLEQLRMAAERSKALSAQVAAAAADAIEEASIPAGVVVMWSGAQSSIPAGWALCDGMNGTPDLRDRFVLGAGGRYGVGASGGEETHKLTSNELAGHLHQLEYTSTMSPTGIEGHGDYNVPSVPNTGNSTIDINYTLIESDDGISRGVPHNNMPPYYALCYIIKVTAGPNDCVTMKEVNEAISAAITGAMEASY